MENVIPVWSVQDGKTFEIVDRLAGGDCLSGRVYKRQQATNAAGVRCVREGTGEVVHVHGDNRCVVLN